MGLRARCSRCSSGAIVLAGKKTADSDLTVRSYVHSQCFASVSQCARAQPDVTTLRRSTGRAFGQQRSRAGHPAHRKALCADGREPNTTAFHYALVSGISQLARRVRHAKPPRIGSLAYRAGRLSAAPVARARYGHPLRFYITPHCPQCPAVIPLKLHLVPVTAGAPFG